MCTYISLSLSIYMLTCQQPAPLLCVTTFPIWVGHTRHILPPSEIDLGLFWAVFEGSEGKHLFHRISRKGRTWQPWVVCRGSQQMNGHVSEQDSNASRRRGPLQARPVKDTQHSEHESNSTQIQSLISSMHLSEHLLNRTFALTTTQYQHGCLSSSNVAPRGDPETTLEARCRCAAASGLYRGP